MRQHFAIAGRVPAIVVRWVARCQNFAADGRGSIAVLAAMVAMVMMAVAALAIDTGKVFVDRRHAQSATDLAAIAAVSDLPNALKAAKATAARNSFGDGTPIAVELGVYSARPDLAPAARFVPAPVAEANAARVTLQSAASLTFGAALLGRNSVDVVTRATATQSALATFAIGSRLLRLEGGLINRVLGALLGTTISLSVMDYDALLAAELDLFDVMTALAARSGDKPATYAALLARAVKPLDVLQAMADSRRAVAGNDRTVLALAAVVQALGNTSARIALQAVIDAGRYDALPLGEKPRTGVVVSALDMLMALAQAVAGPTTVRLALDATVPGILGATLALRIGERPQGTSWITVGAAGARVQTAQMRLLIDARVAGLAPIATVRLPIYLEVAAATATLTRLNCGFPDAATSSATLDVMPSLVEAWIGDVPSAAFDNLGVSLDPPSVVIATLAGLVTAKARAHARIANLSPTPVRFSMSEIASRTRKTVGTRDIAASLVGSLLGNTQLDVTLLGVNLLLPDTTTPLLRTILSQAASPLDQLLTTVLGTLGIGLGQADVWLTGLRCDGAVLVN
jgi:uncharacterized membrane protein